MKYAFIGAGKMASAIIHGMLRGKVCNASDIFVSCPEPDLLQSLSDATAVQILTDRKSVV
jgi:pyrroline-5-carboxylate reductase